MVNIAVRAARRAGEIMVRQMNQLEALKVIEKSRNEFVSQVDQMAEAAIIEVIRDHYPDHAILAEESGAAGEHVVGARSTRNRLVAREMFRPHEREIG